MRVGIIGGKELNATPYEQVAKANGAAVEFHDGKMAGRGSEALDTLVKRCDLVVIVTQINSHAAVRRAQKYCRSRGRRVLIVRRFGLHQFTTLFEADGAAQLAAVG
jgi:hypothetical protein